MEHLLGRRSYYHFPLQVAVQALFRLFSNLDCAVFHLTKQKHLILLRLVKRIG